MIFDRWGNPLGDLPYAIKAIRTRATDGTDTLDITTIGEINKDARLVFKDSMGRWAEYLCQSTQTARAAGMPVTVAYCAGGIAELSRTYIEDKRNRNANAKACLAKALDGTRWTVGTVETGTRTRIADLAFYHCTVLEAVQKTADTYGLEVQTEYRPDPTGNRIGQRIIHLLEHRGSTNTTKRFEYGKDLTQIKRDIDAGDVITRLYGWGKGIEQTNEEGEATGGYGRKISFADVNNGKPYIQDDQALANWGIVGADGTKHHSEASVDFPDCEDPKELLNLTKAALKTRTTPTVSYTADVTALGQAGYDPEGTDVGDSVQIIDTSFATPLRLEGRILQIEEDLAGSLADTKITLGNIRQSYTQRMAAQQQALDKLVSNSGAWNSAAGGTGPYMKDLIDRINQIMNATGGYTYLKPGQGIYVYDKPEDQTPTQCIHIGGGYWRIADHKKPNGDWDFRALANGKGIFADTVFTGRLSDAAGLNFWDMDTGDFSLSARSTIGGNEASSLATQTQAQKLATDAQTVAKSYADSITTYNGGNLVRNPNGDPSSDLDKLGSFRLSGSIPSHPEGSTTGVHLTMRDTNFGWSLDNFRNRTFALSGWAYRKAGNVTSSFGIYWVDTSGTNHWQSVATASGNASGWVYVTGRYTVPSNAKSARLWMQVNMSDTTTPAPDWYWTGLQCTDETAITQFVNSTASDVTAALKAYANNGDTTTLAAAKTFATNQAKSQVDSFEKELTQLYIFNKLTNNGKNQGIYLSNGLLYINATYMKAGIITGGSSYWNLDTGSFYTKSMTAVDMKASGTFTCGSTYKAELNSTGQLAGYRGTSKVGYIDYSSSTYNKDNPSEIWYGMQMQAQGIVRITAPRISTAQTSNTSVTTKQGSTRNFRQNIVTEVRDNGNGTIGWSYGTFELDFINGILVGSTAIGM